MVKSELFNSKDLLVSLKAIVVSVLVFGIGMIIWGLVFFLGGVNLTTVSWLVGIVWIVFSLFLWGYFANKWWGWK